MFYVHIYILQSLNFLFSKIIDNYLKNVNVSTLDDVVAQETILYQDLKNKLAGFVDNDKIDETATKIIEQVKSKYTNNTTETNNETETKTEK